ncbi:MAG: ATP-binding protein [Pseudomonadota bacterium]
MQRTHWIVITGAPCSGKTSVIRILENDGYEVVHETARALLDHALAQGLTLEAIKADELTFERHVLSAKIAAESSLNKNRPVFLDRAIPDSIAYFRKAGFDITEPLASSRLFQYRKIFLFERLLFQKDAVRSEDDAIAAELERLLAESYEMLGYSVLRVPVMPVVERTEFILSHL